MKRIFIVGGDGFARECLNVLIGISGYGSDIHFAGFLGHQGYGDKTDYKDCASSYKGDVSEYHFEDNDFCIIGAGYPELRKKIYDDLNKMGVQFYNLIGAGCILPESAIIGEGNIFVPPFMGSVNMSIGNGNVFNCDVIIGHDAVIGDFNFFGPRSVSLGNTHIGNMNSIGVSSVLMAKSAIGNHNKIAPLSCLYKGCKDGRYMIGNPALDVSGK